MISSHTQLHKMAQKQTGYVKQAMAMDNTAITPQFLNPARTTLHGWLLFAEKKPNQQNTYEKLRFNNIYFKTKQQSTL